MRRKPGGHPEEPAHPQREHGERSNEAMKLPRLAMKLAR